jgi:hypothetical protein
LQFPFSNRITGILGSIAFHLLLIIVFLLFKINGEKKEFSEGIELDLKTLEELAQLEFLNQEQYDISQDQARNIAVDQNEDRVERFEDYQNYRMNGQSVADIVQNRISEDLNKIIDENDLNLNDKELPDIATQELDIYTPKELEEDQVYEGPTNIYFSLEGRKIVKLIVPVYKCEGGGLVQLDIRVSRRGNVEFVSVSSAESTTKDPCLITAAKEAAKNTRFNFDSGAPLVQSGTITFRFIAQ